MTRAFCLFALLTALPFLIAAGIASASEWTTGIVEKRYRPDSLVTLEDVRLGQHSGYDRIVFEFRRGAVPGYRIEYVDKPTYSCGSGKAVWLAGDGWLRISFDSTRAHDDRGQSTVDFRRRDLNLPTIKEAYNTCDFEGEVAWVLGVSSPNRYRGFELKRPARLVVDIEH